MPKGKPASEAAAPEAVSVAGGRVSAPPRPLQRQPRLGETVIFRPNSTSLASEPSARPLAAIVSRVVGGKESLINIHCMTDEGVEIITDLPFGSAKDEWEHWEFAS